MSEGETGEEQLSKITESVEALNEDVGQRIQKNRYCETNFFQQNAETSIISTIIRTDSKREQWIKRQLSVSQNPIWLPRYRPKLTA